MCLISIVPVGVKKDIVAIKGFITQGMSSNSDGSGYAIKKNGKLFLNKGFRSVSAMVDSIEDCKLGLNDELMIHHRTGTSGKRDNINMHPFIVTDDEQILRLTEGATGLPIMSHNGVFGSFSDYTSDYSDTYHFIKDFMSTPEFIASLKRDPVNFEKKLKPVLNSNKLAFLFEDRSLITIGSFTEDEGCLHSNGGYKSYVFDRGGNSSRFLNRGDYVHTPKFRKPTTTPVDKIDFDSMSEADWQDYNDNYYDRAYNKGSGLDSKLENTAVTLFKGLSSIKKLPDPSIRFDYKDLNIREDNYNHFLFVIGDVDFTSSMKKHQGYEIEKFDLSSAHTPVVSVKDPHVIYHVNFDRFGDYCDVYVKSEFKHLYTGLNKLLLVHNYAPSKSTLKKIRIILERKFNKNEFQFKEYGHFFRKDLQHYYDKAEVPKISTVEFDDYPEHQFSEIND